MTTITYLPTSITGCQLWLDGNDPAGTGTQPANGSTVSTWVDKSGNGYNATVAPSRVVGTYSTSFKAVNFATSTTGYITSYSAAPTNETMFVVFNNPSPSAYNFILIGGVQGARSLGAGSSSGGAGTSVGNLNTQVAWLATLGSYTGGTTVLTTSQFTTSTNTISLNGGTAASGGAPGFTAGRVTYLGVDATNGSYYYVGYAMEIIFYNSILTTTQRQTVEAYLAQKWGITSSLPAGHPGLTTQVYQITVPLPRKNKMVTIPKTITTTSTFLPTSITGSQLWLDGADPAGNGVIPANGAAVSIWVDKSGNGRNGTQVNNPTYNLSRKALYFTGTEYYNLPDSTFPSGNSSYTYFMIVNFTSFSSGGILAGGGFTGSDSIGFRPNGPGGGFYAYWFGNDIYSSTTYNINEVVSVVSFFNSPTSSRTLIQNFTTTTTAGGGRNQPAINNTVGKSYGGEFMIGYIHEVIVYNTALSTNDRQTVEGYLAQKWGLSSFLAAGHPGLTTPIYQTVTSVLAPTTAVVSATFIPTSIGGCGIWLDSTDITSFTYSSASNISQWRDKSGFSNHFNTSSGTPTSISDNSRSVVNFTSGTIMTSANQITFTTSSAFFIVSRLTSIGNIVGMLLGFTNINGADKSIRFYGNKILVGTVSEPGVNEYELANATYFVNGTFNPSFGSSTYLNTYSIIGTVAPSGGGTSFLTLSSSFMSRFFIGNIAEFLYYPAGVTSNQRQTIEGYLAQKWGLTASMPAGHPALTSVLYGTTTITLPKQKVASLPKFITTISTFLPNSISGCQLWLDGADQATITGTTTMTSWRDKSANGYTANSFVNSVAYPSWVSNVRNGNGVIQYTAGNGSSIANFVLAQTMSIFKVYYPINQSTGSPFIEQSPNVNNESGFFFHAQNDNNFYIRAGTTSAANFGTTAVSNTWQMIEGINPDPANGNTMAFYVNGTTRASGSTQSGTTTVTKTLYINGRGGANSVSYNTYLAELIIFNTALSTTNRQTVESYLAQKWGLTSSMPAGHPALTTSLYGSVTSVLAPTTITTTFLPTSIAACALWLDGLDPLGTGVTPANGATVSTWSDKSGNGRNTTTTGTVTYSNSGISITSSSSYLTGSFGSPDYTGTTVSCFIVASMNSASGSVGRLLGLGKVGTQDWDNLASMIAFGRGGGLLLRTYRNSQTLASPPSIPAYDTRFLASSGQTSSATFMSINGGTLSTQSLSGAFAINAYRIGHDLAPDDVNEQLNGVINEIIVYFSELTSTQRQQVEGYLAQKWGLTASLPAGHPGLTTMLYGTVALPRQKIRLIPPTVPLVSYTQTFSYTGTNQTFVVPATTTSITVYMWGAGGAGNTNYGGAAAMVQGVFTTTPGETLNILVGQGGTINGSTTFGGGGAGGGNMTSSAAGIGYSGNGFPANGGSGGGRSAIQRGGTDPTNDIVVAGGGGGGSYFSSDYGGSATFSGTANPGAGGLPGLGGTQGAGGAGGGTGTYGQGLGGSRGIGGNTYNNNIYNGGGGGGGGYYGGGAGGTNLGDGAGGGGGSSLTSTLSLISGQSVLGFNSTNGYTAPNNTSPYYVSGVGNGAPSISSNPRAGDNGRVVLVYMA